MKSTKCLQFILNNQTGVEIELREQREQSIKRTKRGKITHASFVCVENGNKNSSYEMEIQLAGGDTDSDAQYFVQAFLT